MTSRSLLFRLSASAVVLIALALTLAAFGLTSIFHREIESRAARELSQIVKVLAAQVRIDASGQPVVDVAPPDPRFDAPYGGLYWQIGAADGFRLRSRSLWDSDLVVTEDRPDGKRWTTDIAGPNKSRLLAVVQDVLIASDKGDVPLQLIAALDRNDLAASLQTLVRLLALSLLALGVILIAAMLVFIRLALRPFNDLGRGLQAIHQGQSRQLSGAFPAEVQHVVDDLNRLIAFQDGAVDRARTQAADLAHGLKTPLTVLGAVARQMRDDNRGDLAEPIDEQVNQMRRQVDRVLARARAGIAAAVGRKSIDVAPVVRKVVRAFERVTDQDGLVWQTEVDAAAQFPGDDGDLTEILGNLLDNARKWARGRISLTAAMAGGNLIIRIEDDGPGLSEAMTTQIARGKRWDESQPGTGFGLAITRDLAEGYNGHLELDRSQQLGGLRATVTLPVARRSA